MEPKLSKVKSVQAAGTWDGKHGTMYQFDYEFEDGTLLQANHKGPDWHLKVGDEAEYIVTREHPTHGKSGKVQKPQPRYPEKQKTGDGLLEVKVGHALKCASALLQGSSNYNNREAIKNAALMIYGLSEELNAELSGSPKPKEEEQDLPF